MKQERQDAPPSLHKEKTAEYIHDFTALGNPFLLLLVSLMTLCNHPQFLHLFPPLLVGFFVNEIVCSGIKYFWHKPRPNGQEYLNGFEKIDAGSFPSIHASRISFVYGALGFIEYELGASWVPFVCLAVILVVGYSRIFLQKHFLVDVLAGYGFGIFWATLLYFWLH
jgi:membrane-associated phospholipid phosphatase